MRIITTLAILWVLFAASVGARGERYVDNGDGTVTDRKTGLMWTQKDSFSDKNDMGLYVFSFANKLGGHVPVKFLDKPRERGFGIRAVRPAEASSLDLNVLDAQQ